MTIAIEPELTAAQLQQAAYDWGLTPYEYDRILAGLGRQPTLTEIAMFSVEWCEHCGYPKSRKVLEDPKQTKAKRNNAAFQIAWLKRIDRAIDFTCLDLGQALVLHLPGEPFIEYQLKAQGLRKDRFVCVAGYGDDGPGYIPTEKADLEGGYEPSVALAAPSEGLMVKTMAKLLKAKAE